MLIYISVLYLHEQKEYSFYPRTWVLPGELNDFRAQFDNQGNSLGNKIFIIKPDTGCQVRLLL